MAPKRDEILFSINLELFKTKYPFLQDKARHTSNMFAITSINYEDEQKNKQEGILSQTRADAAPDYFRCFWDHHELDGPPISCPISVDYEPVIQKYTTELGTRTKTYWIKDNIYSKKKRVTAEGAFCSAECVLAFIQDNARNPRYQNSPLLLLKSLPRDATINPAPHWRCLKAYGGNLTIDEFRANLKHQRITEEAVLVNTLSFLYKKTYTLG